AIRKRYADQRVVNTPDGTEQTYERCGGSYRRKNRQSILELGRFLVDHLAYGARHKVRDRAFFLQLHGSIFGVMVARMNGMACEMRERLAGTVRRDFVFDLLERTRRPELAQEFVRATAYACVHEGLDENQVPACQRHDD